MNLLKEKYPEIFSQINIEKTLEKYPNLDIDNTTIGCHKKIWFKCQMGHNYSSFVYHRTSSLSGCPYCNNNKTLPGFNDLKTYVCNHPEFQYIIDEWDYEKNSLSPDYVSAHSNKKYWFKCSEGHSYNQELNSKINDKQKCPICSNKKLLIGYNDLETWCHQHNREDILDSWDYKKNCCGPKEILHGSCKKYWFKCAKKHAYYQLLKDKIYHKSGCPYCSNNHSTPELTIFEIIKKYADPLVLSGYKIDGWEIDVYSPKYNLCLEYDGIFFHSSDNAKDREQRKNKIILENSYGYKLIRIKETDDASEINSFKYVDNGVLIYYISKDYDNKYFQILSKIIEDIFGIIVDYKDIFNYFTKIKLDKLISSEG